MGEHQPQRLHTYVKDGSLWEGMMPFWKSDNNQYITPDPLSNPIMYYIKWVVSESVGGFNAGLQNNAYTDGYQCPYEIPDQWEYEYQRQWYVDPTLTFKCTQPHPTAPKSTQPHPTAPNRTQPHPTTPNHTQPHPTTPNRTKPHPTTPNHQPASQPTTNHQPPTANNHQRQLTAND